MREREGERDGVGEVRSERRARICEAPPERTQNVLQLKAAKSQRHCVGSLRLLLCCVLPRVDHREETEKVFVCLLFFFLFQTTRLGYDSPAFLTPLAVREMKLHLKLR